jgi:hypothetical protein
VVLLVACLVLVAAASDGDAAVGTAFTYQGRLDLKGAPANGHFEDEPDNWEPGETSRRSPAGSSTALGSSVATRSASWLSHGGAS